MKKEEEILIKGFRPQRNRAPPWLPGRGRARPGRNRCPAPSWGGANRGGFFFDPPLGPLRKNPPPSGISSQKNRRGPAKLFRGKPGHIGTALDERRIWQACSWSVCPGPGLTSSSTARRRHVRPGFRHRNGRGVGRRHGTGHARPTGDPVAGVAGRQAGRPPNASPAGRSRRWVDTVHMGIPFHGTEHVRRPALDLIRRCGAGRQNPSAGPIPGVGRAEFRDAPLPLPARPQPAAHLARRRRCRVPRRRCRPVPP